MQGKSRSNSKKFFECTAGAVQTARIFANAQQEPFDRQEFFQTHGKNCSNGIPIHSNS